MFAINQRLSKAPAPPLRLAGFPLQGFRNQVRVLRGAAERE